MGYDKQPYLKDKEADTCLNNGLGLLNRYGAKCNILRHSDYLINNYARCSLKQLSCDVFWLSGYSVGRKYPVFSVRLIFYALFFLYFRTTNHCSTWNNGLTFKNLMFHVKQQ